MKKMMIALVAMLTIAVQAKAMSYEQARNEALFLTDKMAYELNLTQEQYEAAYEINLDYLMSVATRDDVFGTYWERRNLDLGYILYSWQWDLFRAATYFYRPLYWEAGYWHFGVYARYPHRDYFYFGRPHFYASYRGAHSWRMNGGRSFYETRRDHFRPTGRGSRDTHFGMRNGYDRGDYRSGSPRNSSTRITAPRGGSRQVTPTPRDNNGSGSYGNSRSGSMNPRNGSMSNPRNGAGSGMGTPTRQMGGSGMGTPSRSGSGSGASTRGAGGQGGSRGGSSNGNGNFGGRR